MYILKEETGRSSEVLIRLLIFAAVLLFPKQDIIYGWGSREREKKVRD